MPKITTESTHWGNSSLNIVRRYYPNVNTVRDASKPAFFTVTTRDNNNSTRKSHKSCAGARACMREFKLDGVIFSRATVYLIRGETATRYKLPESVAREVISFDRKGGFAPGSYMLATPCPSARLGARAERGSTPSPNKTGGNGVKRFHHDTSDVRHSLREVA